MINMCVDVAAYPGFCLFVLGVCIRVNVLDGMSFNHVNTDAHTERKQTNQDILLHQHTYLSTCDKFFIIFYNLNQWF
jgi:hypothetical protein